MGREEELRAHLRRPDPFDRCGGPGRQGRRGPVQRTGDRTRCEAAQGPQAGRSLRLTNGSLTIVRPAKGSACGRSARLTVQWRLASAVVRFLTLTTGQKVPGGTPREW